MMKVISDFFEKQNPKLESEEIHEKASQAQLRQCPSKTCPLIT